MTDEKQKKLTSKQLLFCKEYIKDFNATQAAIRAGYSKKTAYSIGEENLRKPELSKKIEELKKIRSEKVEVDAEYVLKRLAEIDQMDVKDIFNDDWTLKPISEWPNAWRTCISGIDIMDAPDGVILKKMKWPDKVKNLELIGKHVGVQAFKEKSAVEVVEMTHEQWIDSLG